MYIRSYKLNNSYTTYVVHYTEEKDNFEIYKRNTSVNPPEIKPGTEVLHYYHGIGIIKEITENTITVNFNTSKATKKHQSVLVDFKYEHSPYEIDSLKICN